MNLERTCVKCGKKEVSGDQLDQIGAHWQEGSKAKHPMCTLIEYAMKLGLHSLVGTLQTNKENGVLTFIHNSCRTQMRNNSRKRSCISSSDHPSSSKRLSVRLDQCRFDFKTQCFYCEGLCVIDEKHPDRKKFQEVRTKDTGIHKATLKICKQRDDTLAKAVELRLLSVRDLVAAEAKYHSSCRTNFENPLSKHEKPGRPISMEKMKTFDKACKQMEEDIELYTTAEFYAMMSTLGNEVYTLKMTQSKLQEKYGTSMRLVSRDGKSNLIVLDKVRDILSEKWYQERKADLTIESVRVIRTAAKLLKEAIKNFDHDINNYPAVEDITSPDNISVPHLLQVFINELVTAPIKQMSLSQAIFSGTRPRSIMPLQFGLAVAADNRLASKWLNNLLYKLGLAISYDEVVRYKQNVVRHDEIGDIIFPEGTSFLQFVADNTDHDIATLDGKNTHHGLGSISIANGKFTDVSFHRRRIPREKREAWSSIKPSDGIKIVQYMEPDILSLSKTVLKPIVQCPSWSGYMSSIFKNKNSSQSSVSMLPIIDLHATDMTALYSLLLFIQEQCRKLKIVLPYCVTFDQPLYVKAYEIASSMKMDIFVRLGGFHQLMSYLGSVGSLMEGSGLRCVLETVYTPITVGHMISGKAYSRAIRGHMLCALAVLSLVLEEFWDHLSAKEREFLETIYESDDPLVFEKDNVSVKLLTWFEQRKKELSENSRTSALWLSYVNYVFIAQEFIRAERTSNWPLHILATKSMINLFAATGHNNYAKTCRLYLQSVEDLERNHPDVYQQFLLGNHTVKRTDASWSGIWTDLSIEQILMKSLKGRSGVIGKGMTENVMRVWTKTMHRCAEVTEALGTMAFHSKSGNPKHKELFASRIKRDYDDFLKIQCWFKEHNPYTVGTELVALDSGLIDDKATVTCDKAEKIGASIQNELTGKAFTEVSFKKSKQVVTLQSLHSTVSIGQEKVVINPLTLFLRLVVVIERKPENEVADYFNYELSPYPMSLFKDGIMRSAQKSMLKAYLLRDVLESSLVDSTRIADGGALLWCCDWKKNESFEIIFQKYADLLKYLRVNIVVFDGYDVASTKDATHSKRSGKVSQTVEIKESNACPADRTTFLLNYTNKERFVKALAVSLTSKDYNVVTCPSDADTTIVSVALQSTQEKPVVVYSDDTDVLCLLIHHSYFASNPPNIYITNMTRKKAKHKRVVFKLSDVNDHNISLLHYLLFAHAFTGCDTTSAIHKFGKIAIFKKLENSSLLRQIAATFYEDDKSPHVIGNASIRFFQLLHSATSTLCQIRKKKYDEMVMNNRANIDPSVLPPSPRAAFFHGLRVYHQLKVWRYLSNIDMEPLQWGWQMKDGTFSPIMTDVDPGPQDLLRVIRCSCKCECDKRCSCRKSGLKCSASCKECLGNSCSNTVNEILEIALDDSEDTDRHFLDAFL